MSTKEVKVQRIADVQRRPSSLEGNPAWRVQFTDGTEANTRTNGAVGYGIANSDLRNVDLHVTYERGSIIAVERVDGRGGA